MVAMGNSSVNQLSPGPHGWLPVNGEGVRDVGRWRGRRWPAVWVRLRGGREKIMVDTTLGLIENRLLGYCVALVAAEIL